MTGEIESGSPGQVAIMVVTTAIEFACGFGLIGLMIFGAFELFDGELTMREFVGLPLSFALTLITGYNAMMVICRPTARGMARVAVLSLVTLAVVLAMIL